MKARGRRNAQKRKKLLAHTYMPEPASVAFMVPPQNGKIEDVAQRCFDVHKGGLKMVEDKAIGNTCIELTGEGDLWFEVNTTHRYLVLFVKNVRKFFEIDIKTLSSNGAEATFTLTNKQSVTRIERDQDTGNGTCTLPMVARVGWNYFNIDIETLWGSAFGVPYQETTEVRIRAECRVWKMFFQERPYSDIELPGKLRLAL